MSAISITRPLLTVVATLSLFGPALAAAADSSEPSPRIIVSSQGSADIAPDMAVLSLTVSRDADSAREALDANSAAMAEVLAAMRAQGIAERDLQTTSFDIQPRYVYPTRKPSGENEPPKLVGYTVRNSLTVRVRDLSKVGALLDQSVSLGVNEGGGIQFSNDDPSAALDEARIKAMQGATSKAQTLASAAGVKLGKVLEISEQSYYPSPQPMFKSEMAMARSADAVPVATGENSYQITVNASFEIIQ